MVSSSGPPSALASGEPVRPSAYTSSRASTTAFADPAVGNAASATAAAVASRLAPPSRDTAMSVGMTSSVMLFAGYVCATEPAENCASEPLHDGVQICCAVSEYLRRGRRRVVHGECARQVAAGLVDDLHGQRAIRRTLRRVDGELALVCTRRRDTLVTESRTVTVVVAVHPKRKGARARRRRRRSIAARDRRPGRRKSRAHRLPRARRSSTRDRPSCIH